MTPEQFLSWLAALPLHKDTSVECGAGNAEIAQFLASSFAKSYAVDINPISLPPDTSVKAICADAGALPFNDASVDLLISMQALHHFDVSKHLDEAHRVLRGGGIFAALCWGEISLPDDIRRAYAPIFDAIAPYWEANRPVVLSGYEGLEFAGCSIDRPRSQMHVQCNLDKLEEIMATWSAVQNAVGAGVAFPDLDLEVFDIDEEAEFDVCWPLIGPVFRKST